MARSRATAADVGATGDQDGGLVNQSASAAAALARELDRVRAAIVAEHGEETVRCRTCSTWMRRSPALEPWQVATHCAECAARIAQAERGRPVHHDRRWEREPRAGKRVEIVRSERL